MAASKHQRSTLKRHDHIWKGTADTSLEEEKHHERRLLPSMYLKRHHVGPENQQEPGFSVVESRRKAFPAIQALLPAIHFWDRGTLLLWRHPSKALGYQGQY